MGIKSNHYISTLLVKGLYSVFTFGATALYTRALGVQLKGEYTWIINFASIISIILGLGMYQSIPFFMRNDNEENLAKQYIDIFFFQFVIYLFFGGILIITQKQSNLLFFIIVLILVDILSQQLNMLLLVENIDKRNILFIAGSFLNLIVAGLVYRVWTYDLYIVLMATIINKLFYIIGVVILLRIVPKPWKVTLQSIIPKVKYGFVPMLSFLLITFNYKLDVLMLKGSNNILNSDLSIYTVGVSIAEIAWLIPDVFKEVLFSHTSKKDNDKEVCSILRISNLIITISILFVICGGKMFIKIFFGKEFLDAYGIVVILFFGIPAMSWFKIVYTYFNAIGKKHISFIVLALSALINIFSNFALIPVCGIYGAAWASVISYTVCGLLFLCVYAKYVGVKIKKMFWINKNDFIQIFKGWKIDENSGK